MKFICFCCNTQNQTQKNETNDKTKFANYKFISNHVTSHSLPAILTKQ